MATAGAMAMIELGQQHRLDGKSLPSRLDEARVCLKEAFFAAEQPNLVFLTNPRPGAFLLNLQFEGEYILKFRISKAQLGNILVDGTAMAFREVNDDPAKETVG
jgi:hypothetical protein